MNDNHNLLKLMGEQLSTLTGLVADLYRERANDPQKKEDDKEERTPEATQAELDEVFKHISI